MQFAKYIMCRRSAPPKALGVKRGRQLGLFFGLFAIYLLSLLRYIAIKYDDDSSLSGYDYYEHNIILWSSNKSKLVIDNNDGDYYSSSSSNKNNCCGPWSCSYFDNFEGIGSPLATVNMEYLASDWQKRPGYEYDGVPVLNGTKSNFYLRCRTKKHIQPGSYKVRRGKRSSRNVEQNLLGTNQELVNSCWRTTAIHAAQLQVVIHYVKSLKMWYESLIYRYWKAGCKI